MSASVCHQLLRFFTSPLTHSLCVKLRALENLHTGGYILPSHLPGLSVSPPGYTLMFFHRTDTRTHVGQLKLAIHHALHGCIPPKTILVSQVKTDTTVGPFDFRFPHLSSFPGHPGNQALFPIRTTIFQHFALTDLY